MRLHQWIGLFSLYFVLFTMQSSAAKKAGCRVKQRNGRYFVVCPQSAHDEGTERSITKRRGPRGKKGESGKLGPPGPPGPQGKHGKSGLKGEDGIQGQMGIKGEKGAIGSPGVKGERGITGLRGYLGPQGPAGIPGNCLKVSPSTGSKSGIHCLQGPIGPEGRTGPEGPTGFTGPSGEKGQQGELGLKGPKGTRGPAGLPGLPGTLGRIMCHRRYSNWVTIEDYQSGTYEVGCNVAEFLQSFSLQTDKSKIRYRFNCCGFN